MTGTTEGPTLADEDRTALYGSVAFAVIGIALTLGSAVSRITQIATSSAVPIELYVGGQEASLPLGPDGTAIDAAVDTATVAVDHPPTGMLVLMYVQAIWAPLFVCAGLTIAALLFYRFARGRVFERRSVQLVTAAAAVVGLGWIGDLALNTMLANYVLKDLSQGAGGTFAAVITAGPLLWVLVLGAAAGALQLGERLHKDTEGLV